MSKEQTYIRPKKERKAAAKEHASKDGFKNTRWDVGAYSRFFLLEQIQQESIVSLDRLRQIITTLSGYDREQIEEQAEVVLLVIESLESILSKLQAKIALGRFKEVYDAIPERKLLKATPESGKIEQLQTITNAMMEKIIEDRLELEKIKKQAKEKWEDLKAHRDNVRMHYDLASDDADNSISSVVNPAVSAAFHPTIKSRLDIKK